MSVTARVNDGLITNSGFKSESTMATQNSIKKEEKKASSGMDKDAFMNILVAQMKYQDPLEPTSNTEYISQYAQFSQVEAMENMSNTMSLSRASDLVGRNVTIDTSDTDGEGATISGKVDSVTYSGSKALLNIGNSSYDAENVIGVDDDAFVEAKRLTDDLAAKVDRLNNLEDIATSDKKAITDIHDAYENLTDYQRGYLKGNYGTTIEQYWNKLKEILAQQENEEKADADKKAETDTSKTVKEEAAAAKEDAKKAETVTDEAAAAKAAEESKQQTADEKAAESAGAGQIVNDLGSKK